MEISSLHLFYVSTNLKKPEKQGKQKINTDFLHSSL